MPNDAHGQSDLDRSIKAAAGTGVPDKGILIMGTDAAGEYQIPFRLNDDGELIANIEGSAADTARDTDTIVIPVQAIDAAGNVLGGTAAEFDTIVTTLGTIDEDTSILATAIATVGTAFTGPVVAIGGRAETTVPTAEADTEGVYQWYDIYGRQINPSYDLTQNADSVIDSTALSGVPFEPAAQTTLTAPGDGNVESSDGYSKHTVAVTVVLNSCTDVIVRVDGTLGTTYGTVSLTSTAVANAAYATNLVTISADGTYLLTFEGAYKNIKPVFDDENGDTDSTVTFQYRGSN